MITCERCGRLHGERESCPPPGETSPEYRLDFAKIRPGDEKPPALYTAYYASLLPVLRNVARIHGYCLALHGSLIRDLDLVAVPWREDAASAQALVDDLAVTCGGYIDESDPTAKPHGRQAYVIHLGGGPYIDLAVMPRILQAEQ